MSDAEFIVDNYYTNPVGYVQDVLGVAKLEDWQEIALNGIVGNKRTAIGSGHGIGKTAFSAWVVHWFIATRPNPAIVVTANTKSQLDTKTWRELSKWNNKALNKEWFEKTATKFYMKSDPETWFASAIPWSENNSEAFAGTHEDHVLFLYDEASAIADIIWEVSEGAMTTEGAKWVALGNTTKNTGRFRECWGKFKHRWFTMTVDSRDVSISDKEQIRQWIEDYGEDSDFARIRIKGEFPRAGANQLISSESVENCFNYTAEGYQQFEIVVGVDIARFGDDQNSLTIRQGRKVLKRSSWRGVDTMTTAGKVVEAYEDFGPDAIFIDGDGVGGGVVDRVKQLIPEHVVIEINSGRRAENDVKYFNKRAEMWDTMNEALKVGIDLERDDELKADLIGPEYGFDNKNRIQLEKKSDMKKRGLKSPDGGDSLAFTYAEKIVKKPKKPKPTYTNYGNNSQGWMG